MNRRSFLAGSAAGITAAANQLKPASRDAEYAPPDWLRYARTVYFDGYSPPVYPHLRDFDARRLVECVLECGGDTLRYQPIGYWAIYPSRAYPHHPELGDRDTIAEVSRECVRAGVHLYCYTPYGHPFMEVGWVDSHPEYAQWVQRDPAGKPYGTYGYHLGWKNRQKVCRLGDTYRAAIRQVVREYCAHDIEGVYFDAPSTYGYWGFCFCDACRRNYRKFTGWDIEKVQSPAAREARIAWYEWGNQCTREDLLDFRNIIHGSGKFMLCHNGNTWQGHALRAQYRIPDGFMVEHATQTNERILHGMMGASMARPSRKLAQMYLGSYCVSNFNQPAHLEPWTVHNTNLEDGDEIRMEGFANLASGGAPLYATLNRLYYGIGSGSQEPVKEVFDLMRRAEPLIKDSVPVAQVSIVPSWGALQLWRTERESHNMAMSEGFLLSMLDSGIAADVCPSTELSARWLESQRVVALCGASALSAEESTLLTEWVIAGGSLLATYDTGLYDEAGELRRDGGALRGILGVDLRGEPMIAQPECYYRIQAQHPLLEDLAPGALIQGDNQCLPVEVRRGAMALADCWNLGSGESRAPAVVVNEPGKGRTVYINGSLELNYASSRVPDQRRLLAAAIDWLARGRPRPFRLGAPTGVYGVLRTTTRGDLTLWLLAALGFKDASAGRMRQEFMPVTNVEAAVLIPEGKQVRSVRLARAGHNLPFRMEHGYAVVTVPVLHIAELMHFEVRS
jgi:hypothetical protein